MNNRDWEEYMQARADQIDEDIAADPAVPAHVRASIRADLARRRERRALMGGGREYRQAQPWISRPQPDPDIELRRLRLRLLELSP
jgi:hypothetical protein